MYDTGRNTATAVLDDRGRARSGGSMIVEAPPKPINPVPPSAAPKKPAFIPPAPRSFGEAGVDSGIVESLILKYLLGVGSAAGAAICAELCMPSAPIIELLASLKQQQIVVHVGAALMSDFNYALT